MQTMAGYMKVALHYSSVKTVLTGGEAAFSLPTTMKIYIGLVFIIKTNGY